MADAFLCRPLPFSILSVSSQTAAGPATNLANDRLGRAWQFAAGGAGVYADLGAATAIDVVALIATNLDAAAVWRVRISTAATVAGFLGSVVYDSGTVTALASADGGKRVHRQALLALATPVTGRLVYIEVNGAGAPSVGRLVVGARLQPENFDYGWEQGVTDRGKTDLSDAGPKGVTLSTKHLQFRWTWGWLTPAEARGRGLDINGYAGSTRPLLFCADPEATDLHNVIGYGLLAEGPRFQQIAVDGFTTSYQLDSELIFSL